MPVGRTILILISVLATAILAVAVIGALPLVVPTDFAVQQLQQAVKAATGRTLTVSGAPRIVLWPELSIEADDAVLSNPPGLYHGQLAAIPRLRLKIDAPGAVRTAARGQKAHPDQSAHHLGQRRRRPRQLVVGRRRIDIPAATAGYRQLLDSLAAAPLQIENGVVRFVDERTGRTILPLTGADLMASFAGPASPFAAHGYVMWNRQRVAMTLFVKDPARIPGQGWPIDVTLNSPLLKFAFSGRAVLNHQASLSGTAELATPSVRDLSGWTGFRLGSGRGLGPLATSGAFDLTNGVLSLTKTVMALDGMNGQGNLKIDFTGDKPRVTAALGMDRLDLNAYAGSAGRRQPFQAAGDDDWSDGELDFAPLRALEAKLSLAVSELRLGGVRTGKANIAAELGGGVLDLSVTDAELYGGRASGRMVLNGSRPLPAVQAAIRAENVDGAALLGSGIGLDTLTGPTALTLSLAESSQREIVSTLRGTAEFRMVDGALRDLNLLKMLRDVKKEILAGWQPAAASRTVFRKLSAHFALEDGIATSRDLQLVAPELTISGSGQADLLRKALDFKVVPKLAAAPAGQSAPVETAALAVPVVVGDRGQARRSIRTSPASWKIPGPAMTP